MKQHYSSIGLERLCGLFGKTRQAFYDYSWRQSGEQLQEALIVDMVKSIRLQLPHVGGLKLLFMLRDQFITHHISIGRDSFFKLLAKYDLLVKRKKHYVRTTWSNHIYKKWPDLTRDLKIITPQQVWVSDITYLRTENGFIYLSLITDACSKKIVGYHLSQHLRVQGCLLALDKAIASLSPNRSTPVIHHSDRGIQYCCEPYIDRLQSSGIQISMTQSGSPYHNAIAERVNGILKTELNLNQTFTSYSAAISVIHQAVDTYNRIRPHMSCENLTPFQAHQQNRPLAKKWKPKKYCKAKSVLL